FHYGIVIKRYRKLQKWSRTKLAEHWPDKPVSVSYIQKIESSERKISDPTVLRQLSNILQIPLWELGLSDYDPFNPLSIPITGIALYPETLESLDQLIELTWFFRQSAPLSETERQTKRLLKLFTQLDRVLPPSASARKKLLYGYGHALQLAGIMHVEQTKY